MPSLTVTRPRSALGLWGTIDRYERNPGRAGALSADVILKGFRATDKAPVPPSKAGPSQASAPGRC